MKNKKNLSKIITNKIEQIRREKGETHADLAAGIGVSRSFVSSVANYRNFYNLERLNKIAIHFDCNLHDIIPQKPVTTNEEKE